MQIGCSISAFHIQLPHWCECQVKLKCILTSWRHVCLCKCEICHPNAPHICMLLQRAQLTCMQCIEAALTTSTMLWLIGAVKNAFAMRPLHSRHAAGYLNYQHFKALTSLDFGIAASKRGQRKSYGWALCSNEIQSLISLKNLRKLVSVICLHSCFKEDMDD